MRRQYKIDAWREYFEDCGLPAKLIDTYMSHLKEMYAAKCPPIFEFRHLAWLVGREDSWLASAINCPEKYYREFSIPKKNKERRVISAPYPSLLECQRWINTNILTKVRLRAGCHGFRKERSILTNASQHLNSSQLLKMDIKDFFPSIKLNRVIAVFKRIGYPQNVSFYLAQLCCNNGKLPQGAATSPAISNIIASKMDARFYYLCKKLRLKYTRYADDITISGNRIPVKLLPLAKKIIEEEGFEVNTEKTRIYRRNKKVVTGISVATEEPKLPKETKRKLRQEVHYVVKYGIKSHLRRNKIRDPFYLASLYGRLVFWKWVEPENTFLKKHIGEIEKRM
jgi:RNA-directed DNA polymerase